MLPHAARRVHLLLIDEMLVAEDMPLSVASFLPYFPETSFSAPWLSLRIIAGRVLCH